ncbi:GTPase [Vibrio sp. JCM 19052]|nr:GTPase [Vibrio sp. JCM 19052]
MNLTLDYASLAILFVVLLILIFGLIALHDIPYEIAKKRNHPHADAIHVAGWVSLFFLHVIWPFLWIWATMYDREKKNWLGAKPSISQQDYEQLLARINQLEQAKGEE